MQSLAKRAGVYSIESFCNTCGNNREGGVARYADGAFFGDVFGKWVDALLQEAPVGIAKWRRQVAASWAVPELFSSWMSM